MVTAMLNLAIHVGPNDSSSRTLLLALASGPQHPEVMEQRGRPWCPIHLVLEPVRGARIQSERLFEIMANQ
jgi:hypothetical protein